ncbi:MAG: hypothetical protein HY040_20775 [Planctomycetes bacterium]|nr:hypothetical protein [Planctomycetota bacterium]
MFISSLNADGLVHQLPADGSFARFDLELKVNSQGIEKTAKGSMVMASVGQLDVDGKKSRWIEFKIMFNADGNDRITVSKALVPESALKAGKNPGAAMIRGWLKDGPHPQDLKDMKSPFAGPLPAFLSGPLKNAKKLDMALLDNKALGKVECAGETGSFSFEQGDERIDLKLTNRLSSQAPFGVVEFTMEGTSSRENNPESEGVLTLKLAAIGKGAKTELPDQK